jgi:glutamate 5-kinase
LPEGAHSTDNKGDDVYEVTVWVIDTRSLIQEGNAIDAEGVKAWAEQATLSFEQGKRPILVCDSAISVGLARMKSLQGQRATTLSLAAMAFGQTAMGTLWETMFAKSGRICAQVLLNQEDLKIDHRKSGIRATLRTLLDMGVVPIISENELSALPPSPLGSVHFLAEAINQMMSVRSHN